MEEETPQTPPTPPQQSESPSQGSMNQGSGGGDIEEGKVWAAIGYLGILFLVPLLAKKDNEFAQYHAKQGLMLFIVSLIIGPITFIPLIGWILAIFPLVLFIMGLVNALGGKKKPLPVIGQYGENLSI